MDKEQNRQAIILVVDDDEFNRKLLEAMLAAEGHAVRSTASGEEALAAVAEQLPDLILLDVMMPGIDGFEVTRRLKTNARSRIIPIILVTSLEDSESRLKGLKAGAEEFLSKPVDRAELQVRVRNLLKVKEYQNFLADHNRILEEQVSARTAELRQLLEQTVTAISHTLEKRDPYAAGHQQRVAKLAAAIATEMGLPPQQVEGIRFGALLHNIGTIAVPADILNRPGKLSDLQFSMVKTHSQAGFEIVKDIPFPWPVAQMVLQHHERMDGSGYPQGLNGEQIILEARILSVADVLVAMVSYRPHRDAWDKVTALDALTQGRGTQFDPAVVDACLRVMKGAGFGMLGAE